MFLIDIIIVRDVSDVNKCIIFDANFLYENKNLYKLFESKKENEEFFVTDLVISEVKSKNDRNLKDMYDNYNQILDTHLNKLYFKLEEKD